VVFAGPILEPDDPPYRGIQIPLRFWKVAAWHDGTALRIFLNSRAKLFCLDAKTGEPVNGFGDHGIVDLTKGLRWPVDPKRYTNTSPPIVYKNLVILGNGVGDRTYVVGGTQDLRGSYKLGIGEMILDLRNVPFTKAETHVKARVDIGSLRVIVPRDVALQVRGDAQLGEVHILGRSDDGRHARSSIVQSGNHVLVLDTHVGIGQVRVTRAVQ